MSIDFNEHKGRALSRSSTLAGIENAFSASKLGNPKALESKQPTLAPSSTPSSFLGVLSDILGTDTSTRKTRMKNKLEDSFLSKSISLDNTASQLAASSAQALGKRKVAKQSSNILSNKKLKRLKTQNYKLLTPINQVVSLYSSWRSYLTSSHSLLKAESLRSNNASCIELLGAPVVVLEAIKKRHVGLIGIVTAVTQNIIYISSCENSSISASISNAVEYVNSIPRATSIIGIFLPDASCENINPLHFSENSKLYIVYGAKCFGSTS